MVLKVGESPVVFGENAEIDMFFVGLVISAQEFIAVVKEVVITKRDVTLTAFEENLSLHSI